ncbi:MAG: hypothetical protein GY797_17695 [Deltaproteobacteria bacterium]|nr:hypothetical protein [Deltaproteobacteria bacterium]
MKIGLQIGPKIKGVKKMAKMMDWEKNLEETFKKEDVEQLCKIEEAIATLYEWDMFKEEYSWTGLGSIQQLVKYHREKLERGE